MKSSTAAGGAEPFGLSSEDLRRLQELSAYREAGREILQILNESGTWAESIERVLATLTERTGCDAVGIRLQDGEDFPYFVQRGFSNSFLVTEKTLLKRTRQGEVCRNRDGAACLQCTCGLVISGRVSPLLTPGGSFWTNDSRPLLQLSPAEDPRVGPRNQCIHHGYASIALIPIRSKGKIVGLVQLNDRGAGRFTLSQIEVLEQVAGQIGEALLRKKMETALLESERQLRESQERLRRMAFEAAAVQERERHRIATDLHDSLGQSLSLAQLKLSVVREQLSGPPRTLVDEVMGMLAQSIGESRELVFALSPPVLYDLGLEAAIDWLIEDVEKKHGLQVEFQAERVSASIEETIAIVVFRAVRELLMNVVKHAGTRTAEVRLRRGDGELEVVVVDDGKGFEPEATPHQSYGLFSVREQIDRLGGTVEVTSAPGLGSRVSVRVPLNVAVRPRG
jgi:signal transduction histidine kinase